MSEVWGPNLERLFRQHAVIARVFCTVLGETYCNVNNRHLGVLSQVCYPYSHNVYCSLNLQAIRNELQKKQKHTVWQQ